MGDETEYQVILCPADTTPDTATDTRKFSFFSDETDEDRVREEVIQHIISDRIDPGIFYKYWDLWSVQPTADDSDTPSRASGSPVSELKARFAQSAGPQGRLPAAVPVSLYFDQGSSWDRQTIHVSQTVYQSFTDWLSKVPQRNSINTQKIPQKRHFHEAVFQTVAAVDPVFARSFDRTNPNHHEDLLKLPQHYETEFVTQLESVVPNSP